MTPRPLTDKTDKIWRLERLSVSAPVAPPSGQAFGALVSVVASSVGLSAAVFQVRVSAAGL